MKRVVIPALKSGLNVIQSRCLASTLTYQSLRAIEEGRSEKNERKYILSQEGNQLQLEWAPDLLIIPTLKDIDQLRLRLEKRKGKEKDDNAIFEHINFQMKLKPLYESRWLRDLFEEHGTKVVYLDAGLSIEESREQGVELYKEFLKTVPKYHS